MYIYNRSLNETATLKYIIREVDKQHYFHLDITLLDKMS